MNISEQIRENRPPYVKFERIPVEDREASMKNGRYMTKDIDFAIITPIGSKDRIPRQVDEWFKMLNQQAKEQRIPAHWPDQYKQAYESWVRGEEIPLSGTPIKGWPILSPAQQANIIAANIRTVEDLAQANDEARRRIGMGANDLVAKAFAWMKTATDRGAIAQENVAMRTQIEQLERHNKELLEKVENMMIELRLLQGAVAAQPSQPEISAEELIER